MTARRMSICVMQRSHIARRSFLLSATIWNCPKTKEDNDAFLRRVVQTIRQEVANAIPSSSLLPFLLSLKPPASLPDQTGETEDTVLDFLDSIS